MSNIRIASWNAQCGIYGVSSMSQLKNTPTPDIEYIAQCARNSGAHVICLQEVPCNDSAEYVRQIADAAAFEFYAEYRLSQTPIPGLSMGLGILSKYRIDSVRKVLLPNPHLSMSASDGTPMHSHDKGLLVADVRGPGSTFSVVCAHLLPFHRFGRAATDEDFLVLAARLRSELSQVAASPAVVCADFNIDG